MDWVEVPPLFDDQEFVTPVEICVEHGYSRDWSYRQGSIGLPIDPSVGVQVNY
jgi:hypothetical protein